MTEKAALRRRLRASRRALTPAQQHRASRRFAAVARQQSRIRRAQHLAVYIANDGELDVGALVCWARHAGKTLWLPALHPYQSGMLRFLPWHASTRLRPNRYGIPEPTGRTPDRRPPWALDVMLTPLVGFDACGNRLGMGGGFYDRTLAAALPAWRPRRPLLVGVAHECQRVEALPSDPWDMKLGMVLTDRDAVTVAQRMTN